MNNPTTPSSPISDKAYLRCWIQSRILGYLRYNSNLGVPYLLQDSNLELASESEIRDAVEDLVARQILEKAGYETNVLQATRPVPELIKEGILYETDQGTLYVDDPAAPYFLMQAGQTFRPNQVVIREFIQEFPGRSLELAAALLAPVLRSTEERVKNQALRPMIEQGILLYTGDPPVLTINEQEATTPHWWLKEQFELLQRTIEQGIHPSAPKDLHAADVPACDALDIEYLRTRIIRILTTQGWKHEHQKTDPEAVTLLEALNQALAWFKGLPRNSRMSPGFHQMYSLYVVRIFQVLWDEANAPTPADAADESVVARMITANEEAETVEDVIETVKSMTISDETVRAAAERLVNRDCGRTAFGPTLPKAPPTLRFPLQVELLAADVMGSLHEPYATVSSDVGPIEVNRRIETLDLYIHVPLPHPNKPSITQQWSVTLNVQDLVTAILEEAKRHGQHSEEDQEESKEGVPPAGPSDD